MQSPKLIFYILIVFLIAACSPLAQTKHATSSVVDNTSTTTGITEYAAFQLLLEALEQRQITTDCLGFRSENNADENTLASVWEFAVVEVHDEVCGGDSYVGHVRNRYRISSDGSLMRYNVRDADYELY